MDFRLLHGLVKLFGGLWFRYFGGGGASYCLICPFMRLRLDCIRLLRQSSTLNY